MSCSSRIGAYPALRLAFVRLDDIGSAVAPLTGFLPSIGRSISFYPAILCAPIFFSFQPSIPHDHSPRGAVGSRGVAIQSRSLWENPRQCGKACRGNQAVSRVTRISPEAPSQCVAHTSKRVRSSALPPLKCDLARERPIAGLAQVQEPGGAAVRREGKRIGGDDRNCISLLTLFGPRTGPCPGISASNELIASAYPYELRVIRGKLYMPAELQSIHKPFWTLARLRMSMTRCELWRRHSGPIWCTSCHDHPHDALHEGRLHHHRAGYRADEVQVAPRG